MGRRILLYVYALAGGGAERVVATLASGLATRGHAVTLATDFTAPEAADLVGGDVRRIELGRSHARTVLTLARLLRRERPDASISATGVSNLKHMLAASLAGRQRRAIPTFHGHVESEPGHLSQAGNRLAPVLTRLAGRSVFVSDELLADFVGRGADPRRSLRIYNPVLLPTPGTSSGAPGSKHVLAIGRLVALKGFGTFIRAFARLDDPTTRLTILGEGPERVALAAEIERLGLRDRVALPGWADPAPFYGAAGCFVCASQRESFGNVIVEALAHGLPVVATDCGGPREILEDGRFGRIIPVGDEAALATAMAAALADPGDPEPRRIRALAFAPDVALDAYEAMIETVIAAAA